MKKIILPFLICPACLPKEQPLRLATEREADGDIVAGTLSCGKCRRYFPVRDGIAHLLADPDGGPSGGQRRYEETGMTDRYLWSHYGDLLGDRGAGDANARWAELLAGTGTAAFEAGCSVGRITFEMAARNKLAVGCDLSLPFIRTARRLARDRRLKFTLPLEGNLRESFEVTLPESWNTDSVEFILADALRIPFARETFSQVASLNLLDRVSYPLAHLYEMNRLACTGGASLLFADPFSWSTDAAPEEVWLGGTTTGPYRGRGAENVRRLLEGQGKILAPPWRISREGAVAWRLRTHRNHYEVITSQFLAAVR